MNAGADLFQAAREVQEFCDSQGWRSCFIGGLAVLRWSQPRVTRDVALVLLAGFGGEEPLVRVLLERFRPRIPDAAAFALRSRVVLLTGRAVTPIDVSLGALPFEERMIARASNFQPVPGLELRTCSAEDLMVLKLFAGRAIDLRDAEGIAVRLGGALDWDYVQEQLAPLAEAKQEPAILAELARMRRLAATLD